MLVTRTLNRASTLWSGRKREIRGQHRTGVILKTFLRAALSLGFFSALIYLESRHPLRRERESKPRRIGRNLAITGLSAIAIQYVETPVVRPIAELVGRRRLGLVKMFRFPRALETLIAIVLMDYTLFLWHVMTHRIPLLWRFHAVHHIDRDLDASTALRFHFGELILSVPYRAVQVIFIGADAKSFSAWQSFLSLSILFHHSNLRLPEKVERFIRIFWVTPRLHGIHHSNEPEVGACNWSSGLTVWDKLHRTLSVEVPQENLTMGITKVEDDERCMLPGILILPFEGDAEVESYRHSATARKESAAILGFQPTLLHDL